MIGIFDSGAGGLAALRELRRLCPTEDVLFLADRKNAPYGTRSEDEVLRLTKENIEKLCGAGAERVLIACCTASTVFSELPQEHRRVSIPIITPTARAAAGFTENGRIAVIATKRTVGSGAFSVAIRTEKESIRVFEYEAQELVEIAERVASGAPLSAADRECIESTCSRVLESGADTLVLGCTHFSHLEREIGRITNNNIRTVDAAKTGASLIAECAGFGFGATVFL